MVGVWISSERMDTKLHFYGGLLLSFSPSLAFVKHRARQGTSWMFEKHLRNGWREGGNMYIGKPTCVIITIINQHLVCAGHCAENFTKWDQLLLTGEHTVTFPFCRLKDDTSVRWITYSITPSRLLTRAEIWTQPFCFQGLSSFSLWCDSKDTKLNSDTKALC